MTIWIRLVLMLLCLALVRCTSGCTVGESAVLPCEPNVPPELQMWATCRWDENFAANDGTIVSTYQAEVCVDFRFSYPGSHQARVLAHRSSCVGPCMVIASSIRCIGDTTW